MNEPLEISSLQNPKVKRLVKLRQRSQRDSEGLLLIEGRLELARALDNGLVLSELYICPDLLSSGDQGILDKASASGAEIFECTVPVFEKIAYRGNTQGIAALAPAVALDLGSFQPPGNALIVVAEAVEKPGNLGSILRSADAAGAHAVIVCDRCTDINNPNVVRASIGTLFCIPVIEASSDEVLEWLRAHEIRTLAATPEGKSIYTDVDMTGSTAVIVGTEHEGLSGKWLENTDLKVSIPMMGQADSLNVSAATTILLYEALRQRAQ